jgi:hypothetical protein
MTMRSSNRFPPAHSLARLAIVLLAAGCGGRVDGPSSSTDPVIHLSPFGPKCIDIAVGPSDAACTVDQDCTFVLAGHVCDGHCACDRNASVSQSAASRVNAALSSLALNQSCECGFAGYARCIGGQCQACTYEQGACMAAPSGDQ